MKILIFIVAYNAEKTIESVLKRIPEEMRQYDTEVLIIDDASSDSTWECAERFKRSGQFPFKLNVLVNPVNQGYGGNQKIGYLYAIANGFDLVALVHGDGQYAPEALPMLVKPIVEGQADAVFGSRMMSALGALKGGMPLYKYVGNRILTAFQNMVLQSNLSEYHTGYRIYSTRALEKLPFQFNTDDFHFDTEIIIQFLLAKMRIKELSIPTYYGSEKCHVDGMKYAGDVAVATTVARLQSFSLMYRRQFDITGGSQSLRPDQAKLSYDSTDSRVVASVPVGSKIIDLGAGASHLVPTLKERGCTVVGIGNRPDRAIEYDAYYEHDPASCDFPANLADFDYALLLDLLEQQRSPESFVCNLAKSCSSAPNLRIIITAGNVGFFITRLMLLLGQFNYGKRGILDLRHTRLFTFNSLRILLESNGFKVLTAQGVPAPFPLVITSKAIAQALLRLSKSLIALSRGLFSFEMIMIVHPWPSLSYILDQTELFSADRCVLLDTTRSAKRVGIAK